MYVTLLFLIVFFVNVYGIYFNFQVRHMHPNRLVLFIFLVGLLHFLVGLLIYFHYPIAINLFLTFPLSLIFGPVVLFLFKQYVGSAIKPICYLHLIPFFIAISCFILLICNVSYKYAYADKFFIISNILSVILYLSYLIWISLRLQMIGDAAVCDLKRGKKWMIPLFMSLITLCITVLFKLEEGDLSTYQFMVLLLFLLFLFPVLQFSYKNPFLMKFAMETRCDIAKDHNPVATPKSSERMSVVLPFDLEFVYIQRVEEFIRTKGYLDIDLNREQLCEQLGIKKNNLGPFLNKFYKKNFNGFINQLRLGYAAQLLRKKEFVYTIDDLSFICGFRSRASFYRNFIAEFGCSPLQYRTELLRLTDV